MKHCIDGADTLLLQNRGNSGIRSVRVDKALSGIFETGATLRTEKALKS